jgi:hypothetical protein
MTRVADNLACLSAVCCACLLQRNRVTAEGIKFPLEVCMRLPWPNGRSWPETV